MLSTNKPDLVKSLKKQDSSALCSVGIPLETELSGWRTLEVPEQKDIQLVQFWDKNEFGQHVLLNL